MIFSSCSDKKKVGKSSKEYTNPETLHLCLPLEIFLLNFRIEVSLLIKTLLSSRGILLQSLIGVLLADMNTVFIVDY